MLKRTYLHLIVPTGVLGIALVLGSPGARFLGCSGPSGAPGWSSYCIPISYGCASDLCALEECSSCGATNDVSFCVGYFYACNPSYTGCWQRCQ